MFPDANDVLMGGGGAPALRMGKKWKPAMAWSGGPIAGLPTSYQTTDQKGVKRTFPSGDPIMGVAIPIQTAERDPNYPGDDGVRTMYLDGQRQIKAVRLAVQATGERGLAQGGEIFMRWTKEVDVGAPSMALEWEAAYKPPVTALPGDPAGPSPFSAPPPSAAPAPSPAPATSPWAPAPSAAPAPSPVPATSPWDTGAAPF